MTRLINLEYDRVFYLYRKMIEGQLHYHHFDGYLQRVRHTIEYYRTILPYCPQFRDDILRDIEGLELILKCAEFRNGKVKK